MTDFKQGDRVERINGRSFSDGSYTLTVSHRKPGRIYLVETGTWIPPEDLSHADRPQVPSEPAPPKPGPAPTHEVTNDGSSADYYKLPESTTELYHLINHKNMNANVGEMFRALYRYGGDHHSSRERDMKKVKRYAEMELERLANEARNTSAASPTINGIPSPEWVQRHSTDLVADRGTN